MTRRTVMVVDADPGTARKVRKALEASPYEVLQAGSLQEAVDLVDGRDLAALFAALTLPGGTGYDLARRIRERRPDAAVFLLWGGFEVLDGARAKAAGVTAGIRRPLTADSVLAQLEAALGPLTPEPPTDEVETVESVEEDLPPASVEILEASVAAPVPPPASERLAAFIPGEEPRAPTVGEDPATAAERAVLAVLPEVLEVVLAKALLGPGPTREAFQRVLRQAVREHLEAALREAAEPGGEATD